MLSYLRIKNLATIEDLEVSLGEGFTVLTGETGAGKSIIIDSIRLVCGEKAAADLIRTGKTDASVESIFRRPERPPAGAEGPAAEDEGEVVIRRQMTEQGGGKALVNGILVPVKKLKELGAELVDVYGQNDHVFLLHLENQLQFLDAFVGGLALRDEVARAAQALKASLREKRDLEARERERAQRLDFLSYQMKEITEAGLRPGEDDEIQRERHLLRNAEKIGQLLDRGLDLSDAGEDSLSAILARLDAVCGELTGFDPAYAGFREAFAQSAITAREFADSLVRFKAGQDFSPERLEDCEERLSRIERLKRKYGPGIPEILAFAENAKREASDLARSQETLEALQGRIEVEFARYAARAAELTELRRRGAAELERLVEKEIAQLGMAKARFAIRLATTPATAANSETVRELGCDDVEFLISPNPGEEIKPLRRIASGGELSRIMLALKSVGKERDRPKTLIFDEIDAGIGGTTAEAIAHKLRTLARTHQILCITHLPQIASFARHHFRIEKTVDRRRTYTAIKALDFEERVAELARLTSGSQITETSLRNAREMLERNREGD
ncbi:MAG: DNA repair protein RecN [Candidatus Aminicenantes bacterium]|nr:DNA repair protein RecN [Candidatus Aminicenantes bacterium]